MSRINKPENVVQMAQHRGSAAGDPALLPSLIQSVMNDAVEALCASLVVFVESVEDHIFQWIEASPEIDQHLRYLESMRLIGVKKSDLFSAFLAEVRGRFSNPGPDKITAKADMRSEPLALVSHDQLERQIAIESMVDRSERELGVRLHHLAIRLDTLYADQSIGIANVPLGPRAVARAFDMACSRVFSGTDFNPSVRIYFYKLFDRRVLKKLGNIADSANHLLIREGVCTNLSDDPRAYGRFSSGRPHLTLAPVPEAVAQVAIEAAMQRQGIDPQRVAERTDIVGSFLASIDTSRREGDLDMAALLTHIQSLQNYRAGAEIDVQGALTQAAGRPMTAATAQIVSLVDLLFETALADRAVSLPVKNVIAQIQLPFLRLAMIEPEVFDRPAHPARLLMNEMADMAWQLPDLADVYREPALLMLQEVAGHLRNEMRPDGSLCAKLLVRIDQFRTAEYARLEKLEQRSRTIVEAEQVRRASAEAAGLALSHCVAGRELPRFVAQVFDAEWRRALAVIHARHGVTSPQWQQAITLTERFLDSCEGQPSHLTTEDLRTIDREVRELLDYSGIGMTRMQEFFRLLQGLQHLRFPMAFPGQAGNEEALFATELPSCVRWTLRPVDSDFKIKQLDLTPFEMDPRRRINPASARKLVARFQDGDRLVVRIGGNWVRVKLVISQSTGRLLLANHQGSCLTDVDRDMLAQAFLTGNAEILSADHLFDRAMTRVFGEVRARAKAAT